MANYLIYVLVRFISTWAFAQDIKWEYLLGPLSSGVRKLIVNESICEVIASYQTPTKIYHSSLMSPACKATGLDEKTTALVVDTAGILYIGKGCVRDIDLQMGEGHWTNSRLSGRVTTLVVDHHFLNL